MDTPRRTYETTFIINASLDDPQVESVLGRVQETITKNGGTIIAVNKWGRKRLAYQINKKTTGFYVNIEFDGPGSLLSILERAFQLDEMVLRNLTIVLDRKALAARKAALAQAALAAIPVTPATPAAPVTPAPPATPPASTREPLFDERPEGAKE